MIFTALAARVERAAGRAVRARSAALIERIREDLPRGVGAEATEDGVRLSGRGLRRRFALEPALRWLIAGLVRW